jgi:hypothetical protein
VPALHLRGFGGSKGDRGERERDFRKSQPERL